MATAVVATPAAEGPAQAPDLEMSSTRSEAQESSAPGSNKADDVPWAAAKGPPGRGGSFRHGGTLPSAVCLSKAAIGAGILSVAVHSAEVGFVYQFSALFMGALLTLVSIHMIAKASVATHAWSYEDICDDLFHPAMSLFTGFINVCNCLGSAAGYLIVCGQVFQVVSGANESARRVFVVLVGILVCGPLALARHVSFMRHLAAGSVAALMLLVVTVIWFYGENGADESVTPTNAVFGTGGATVFAYMNSVNNIVFAYNNQFNVPQLTGELTPTPSVSKMTRVSLISTSLCFVLYGGVSVFGVLAFGVGEHQKDSLIIDLAPARKQPLVLITMLAVMFSVLTCFQFHIYPVRQFAAYAVRKARGRGAKDESTDVMYGGRSLTRWMDIAAALAAVLLVILIAVVISSLRTILDFVGAFAAAYVSYVVPPLWVIQILRRKPGFSWYDSEVLFCLFIFALGCFFFVFGTYAAIGGAIHG